MEEPIISQKPVEPNRLSGDTEEAPAHETAQPGIVASPTEFCIIRLGTGEDFTSRLLEEFRATGAPGGSIVSAIGSFSEVVHGEAFYHPDGSLDMRQITSSGNPFETGVLSGHLGHTEDGEAIAHVHALFGKPDGSLFGGHLFTGKILVTLELTIALHSSAGWRMRPHCPEPHLPMSIPRRAFLPYPTHQTEKEKEK
jgi:predicted DNA-binding protein with PD1-like motif